MNRELTESSHRETYTYKHHYRKNIGRKTIVSFILFSKSEPVVPVASGDSACFARKSTFSSLFDALIPFFMPPLFRSWGKAFSFIFLAVIAWIWCVFHSFWFNKRSVSRLNNIICSIHLSFLGGLLGHIQEKQNRIRSGNNWGKNYKLIYFVETLDVKLIKL